MLPLLLACGSGAPPPADPAEPAAQGEPRDASGVPAHMAPLPAPADNPQTAAGAALGRALFYDPSLSRDGDLSCASCHQQRFAFGDDEPRSDGPGGAKTAVNTPPLVNLAWAERLFWDGRAATLEDALRQHLPDPAILAADLAALGPKLSANAGYPARFADAFPGQPVDSETAVKALAQFVRSLVSFDAPIDRLSTGGAEVSPLQQEGVALLNDRLRVSRGDNRCNLCHAREEGLPKDDGARAGLFTSWEVRDNGRGARRVPTMRNIAVTAPYMSDGSLATLADVVGHYDALPATPDLDTALQQDGRPLALALSREEAAALAALLELFTDEAFLKNPAFGPP